MTRLTPVNISLASFVRIMLVAFALLVVWALRDIIMLIFLAVVLAAALSPWVKQLVKFRLPRVAAVVILYCLLISIVLVFVLLLIPVIRQESASLANVNLYEKLTDFFTKSPGSTGSIVSKENVSLLSKGVFAGLKGVLGGFASTLLVLVITFYFIIDEENIRKFWIRLVPRQYRDRFSRIAHESVERIGSWFRGQILISLLIGVLSYAAYVLIGVPNAPLLALISGTASFIPVVGTVIGLVPAVALALTISQVKAIIVLAVGIAINQFIANAIVPKVMSKAVGLNPVIIIIIMLVGAQIAGGIGLLLAVPIGAIVDVVVREYRSEKKEGEEAHA